MPSSNSSIDTAISPTAKYRSFSRHVGLHNTNEKRNHLKIRYILFEVILSYVISGPCINCRSHVTRSCVRHVGITAGN